MVDQKGYDYLGPSYGNDLSVPAPSPRPSTPNYSHIDIHQHTKRKQTLLSLLDALNELNRDPELNGQGYGTQIPSFEDDRDVPTVDEHLQRVGAESFMKFQRRIHALDKELRNFANAARQLGSSVRLLSSAFQLRDRLARVLFLFRENAAELYPRKISRQSHLEDIFTTTEPTEARRPRRRHKAPPIVARPVVDEKLMQEDLPFQLEALAEDVMTFLDCLNEFPEFTDEAVNTSIRAFDGDLRYWASCLEAYEGQLRYPAVERYVHDLASEMGEHIDNITSTLSVFIEIGVPTIRFAQKHGAMNLLNLSTVATFFSAVTATTLQFSYQTVGTAFADLVNVFWFSSLVFSIAAAVNSLLGLTWKQAMYRSPRHRVPWWVLFWIKRSPLVFLVISVACFSIGLVFFAFSSGQNTVTCIITSVFTAFTSFGLAVVSAWFAIERWIYFQHHGQKWLADVLADVLTDAHKQFSTLPGISLFYSIYASARARLASITLPSFKFLTGRTWKGTHRGGEDNNGHHHDRDRLQRDDLSIHSCSDVDGRPRRHIAHLSQSPEPILALPIPMRNRHVSEATSTNMSPPASPEPSTMHTMTTRAGTPLPYHLPPNRQDSIASSTAQTSSSITAAGAVSPRSRFASAVRSVMMLQSIASGPFTSSYARNADVGGTARAALQAEHHHHVVVSGGDAGDSDGKDTAASGEGVSGDAIVRIPSDQLPPADPSIDPILPLPHHHHHHHPHARVHTPSTRKKAKEATQMRKSRVANLVPRLKSMEVTQDLAAHQALVRHLQFSPDGQWLATSSWDKTSIVFRVGDPFLSHRILAHAQGFVGQVAWSPSGNFLLTRVTRKIKIWTEEGVCRKTIDRPRQVNSLAWFPGGEAFMSVEGCDVVKLDLNGNILDTYNFDRMILHDVAITPDCQRMLGVGPATESPNGRKPSRSRVEKRLLVYNLDTKRIENQTPVLNDVRDITLAKHGHVALVSYENKAPPQLWRLESIRTDHSHTMRLSLRHTYMPSNAVDFAGPSYFGGREDQLVLCAAKSGDIHIWDRESATLLHHVHAQSVGGDLTCIAWNHALDEKDGFMFATGSHDGAVKIWTSPPPPDGLIDRSLRILTGSSSQSQQQYGTPESIIARSASSTPLFDYDGGGIVVQSPTPIHTVGHTVGQDIAAALGRDPQEHVTAASVDVRAIAFTPAQALGNIYESEHDNQNTINA